MGRGPTILAAAVLLAATPLPARPLSAEPSLPADTPKTFVPVTASFDVAGREVDIRVRDGLKLHPVLLVPKASRAAPILLDRTPYDTDGGTSHASSAHGAMVVRPSNAMFLQAGYILAFEKVRGKHRSEGDYVNERPWRGPLNPTKVNHATDALDMIDRLVKKVPEANDRGGSDPAKPVPYRLRPIRPTYAKVSTWAQWPVDDQRPFSDRADMLADETPPLAGPVAVAGGPMVNLIASTSGIDGDVVVKLIDVYPDDPAMGGDQLAIGMDVLRGRYLGGFGTVRPIAPDAPLAYRFAPPHANHVFLPATA